MEQAGLFLCYLRKWRKEGETKELVHKILRFRRFPILRAVYAHGSIEGNLILPLLRLRVRYRRLLLLSEQAFSISGRLRRQRFEGERS